MAFTYDIAQLPSEGRVDGLDPDPAQDFVRLLLNDTQEAQAAHGDGRQAASRRPLR